MAGVRVYELARDLGVPSKNLIEELRNQGIEVKSHMSTMDEETAGLVLDLYRPQETAIVTAPPPTESPVMPSPILVQPAPYTVELPSLNPQPEPTAMIVRLPEAITVKDFADSVHLKSKDVLMQRMSLRTVASINTVIGLDLANPVAHKLGRDVPLVSEEETIERPEDSAETGDLQPRA